MPVWSLETIGSVLQGNIRPGRIPDLDVQGMMYMPTVVGVLGTSVMHRCLSCYTQMIVAWQEMAVGIVM